MSFFEHLTKEKIALDDIKVQSLSCTSCQLCETRQTVVFGSGNPTSKLMIIGEAPGDHEDQKGEPFIGRSGQLLTSLFESVGLSRETDMFITNIVKCRPPKNRNPYQVEINACSSLLSQQLTSIQPQIVILLGSPSMRTLLSKNLKISEVRGQWFKKRVKYMKTPLYIMPIFHPSYLLRNPSNDINKPKWNTLQDLLTVKNKLDKL